MERFVRRQNIEHYREMLKIVTDPVQRRMIEKLLLEEEAFAARRMTRCADIVAKVFLYCESKISRAAGAASV